MGRQLKTFYMLLGQCYHEAEGGGDGRQAALAGRAARNAGEGDEQRPHTLRRATHRHHHRAPENHPGVKSL